MSVTIPSSTAWRSASCCALEKRWISSMKSTVRRPGLRPAVARPVDHPAHLGHPGTDGGQLLVHRANRCRHEPGHRRLAGAGRPEEDHRADGAGLERHPERSALRKQVALADHLVEGTRPHARRQRGVLREIDAQAGAEEILLHAWILPVSAAGIG